MDTEAVIQGSDGWLFLAGGTNEVLRLYTDPEAFREQTVVDWVTRIRLRSDWARRRGIVYQHLFVPDKLTVYFDRVDLPLPYRAASPSLRVPAAAAAANIEHAIIDVLPAFMAARQEKQLYWKTDTHWTFQGCLQAYWVICSQLNIPPNDMIPFGNVDRKSLYLDLGSKLTPPIKEDYESVAFLASARRFQANKLVKYKEHRKLESEGGLHIGSQVAFRNDSRTAAPKRVVLFGDSYSEYRTHLLTGMLAETVRELHFVWSADIDWRYVDRVKPDILITETAERFANQVPMDELDLATYVPDRLARFKMGYG